MAKKLMEEEVDVEMFALTGFIEMDQRVQDLFPVFIMDGVLVRGEGFNANEGLSRRYLLGRYKENKLYSSLKILNKCHCFNELFTARVAGTYSRFWRGKSRGGKS